MLKPICQMCSAHCGKLTDLSKQMLRKSSPIYFYMQQASQQTHSATSETLLKWTEDRYKGVILDLTDLPTNTSAQEFENVLKVSLCEWVGENRPAVWMHIPVQQSHLMAAAASQGFVFHHAEGLKATMCQWLSTTTPNKLPRFATHQVGVAGCVVNDKTKEVLVIKDINRKANSWKFPGGLSELKEDLYQTAEREVFEETGIKSECQGILTFRQQHNQPGAFGRSDLYFVCHMKPLTYDINIDHDEIDECAWVPIDELQQLLKTPITQRILKILKMGVEDGFDKVHLVNEEFDSVYKGLKYKLYHRDLSDVDNKK